jgi:AmiR/NasT family two-component response regulator
MMKSESLISLILFDNGRAAPGLDGLAAAVAIFGQGRFLVASVHDPTAVRAATDAAAERVVVVNVDDDPEPKQTLADLAEAGFPVVVLTDGRDDTVAEHARSVGAAACLPLSLPARELISRLAVSLP